MISFIETNKIEYLVLISFIIKFINIKNNHKGAKFLNTDANPITPQATLSPLFPVVKES